MKYKIYLISTLILFGLVNFASADVNFYVDGTLNDYNYNPYVAPEYGIVDSQWEGNKLIVNGFVKTNCGGATINYEGIRLLEGHNTQESSINLEFSISYSNAVTTCKSTFKTVYEITEIEKKDYNIYLLQIGTPQEDETEIIELCQENYFLNDDYKITDENKKPKGTWDNMVSPNDGSILKKIVIDPDDPNIMDEPWRYAYYSSTENIFWVMDMPGELLGGWYGPFQGYPDICDDNTSTSPILNVEVIEESNGDPIKGAVAYLGSGYYKCHTDSKGKCKIKDFPAGDYNFGVFKKGYVRFSEQKSFQRGTNDIVIKLEKSPEIPNSFSIEGTIIEIVVAQGSRSEIHFFKIKYDGKEDYIFDEIGRNEGFEKYLNKRVKITGFREVGYYGEEGIYVEKIAGEEEIPPEEEVIFFCNGCLIDKKCYPKGYRKKGEYCSDNEKFVSQLEAGKSCDNNFECKSNVCIDGECISGGLLRQVISWLKGLFGIN